MGVLTSQKMSRFQRPELNVDMLTDAGIRGRKFPGICFFFTLAFFLCVKM